MRLYLVLIRRERLTSGTRRQNVLPVIVNQKSSVQNLVEGFITEDYKESVKGVLDEALKGKQTANYAFPLYSKTNARIDVLLNSSTRRNTRGEIVGVVGVGQDITELKTTHIALKETNNRLIKEKNPLNKKSNNERKNLK
jgi:PAS/PAC sensor signal transduction histidine kinase (EC 2.7.13.3)